MKIELKITGYCVTLCGEGKIISSETFKKEDNATKLLMMYRSKHPKLFSHKRPIYSI